MINMNISSNKNSYIAEINVNAMVGIVLVLLTIFMIVQPTIDYGESVTLPKAINPIEDQNIAKETAVIISIPDDGTYYLGKEPVTLDGLTEKIKEMRNHKIEGNTVYISGGKLVRYGSIINTLSALRKAGIRRIGLVTKKDVNPQYLGN